MRIISKFKDYYDNVFQDYSGRVWDRSSYYFELPYPNKWSRKNQINKITNKLHSVDVLDKYIPCNLDAILQQLISDIYIDSPKISDFLNTRENENDRTIILGYCGKVYFFILHMKKVEGSINSYSISKLYSDVDSYLLNYPNSKATYHDNFFRNGMLLDEWNIKYTYNNKQIHELFVLLDTPIFIITRYTEPILGMNPTNICLFTNPPLKLYGIQRVLDPFTVYQDIDRYINNDLVKTDNPDIVRSDELIRDSKGMDNWSFKQVGPKKRKQKR